MTKKEKGIPVKGKDSPEKTILNMFNPNTVKDMGLQWSDLFVLREILLWISSPNMPHIDGKAGIRYWWLSLKHGEVWGMKPETLRNVISHYEKSGLVMAGIVNRRKEQGSGKRLYYGFMPDKLKSLLNLEGTKLSIEIKDRVSMLLGDISRNEVDYEQLNILNASIKEQKSKHVACLQMMGRLPIKAQIAKDEKLIRKRMNQGASR